MSSTITEFDIGVSVEGEGLSKIGEDFCQDLRALGVSVAAESRSGGAIKASLDWVIPRAVAIFIAHKYLGTLLEEAAKDHYFHASPAWQQATETLLE